MKIKGSPEEAEARTHRRIQELIVQLDKMRKVHEEEEGRIKQEISDYHEYIQIIRSSPKEDFDYDDK